jgi:hypothetical protein
MTKKDYIAIANIIKSTYNKRSSNDAIDFKIDEIRNNFVISLANYFEIDNPKFNRPKFINACFGTVQSKTN